MATPALSFVPADPYAWPYDGDLRPGNTALILIDWQQDFCGPGGYVDLPWATTSPSRDAVRRADAKVLAAVRKQGFHVVHTREGHKPDLSDLPAQQALALTGRSARAGTGSAMRALRAHPGPRRGGLGHHPRAGAAAGRTDHRQADQGRVRATDIDLVLRNSGITHLIFTGITTDVCVHTIMREANDRGYECLLLERLHRRHRLRQLRGRAEDGHDAGRRLRGGEHVERSAGGHRMTPATTAWLDTDCSRRRDVSETPRRPQPLCSASSTPPGVPQRRNYPTLVRVGPRARRT